MSLTNFIQEHILIVTGAMEHWEAQMFKFNKVYNHDLTGTYSFGDLDEEALIEIFKDGRVASHLLERQLTKWYPSLTHVKGCKDHDHVDKFNFKYDAKNFTKSGLGFMPSSMLGTGRKFDQKLFEMKSKKMNYICCDIMDFPRVRVVFKKGCELVKKYPTGKISSTQREVLFSE